MNAYDKTYLESAMAALGSMLDYAVNACGEDLQTFYHRFLSSGIARQISIGNPRYLCGKSGIELACDVAIRTGEPLREEEDTIDMGSQEYWTGWTMAYLQWSLAAGYDVLRERGLGIMDVYSRYSTLHEADPSKSLAMARTILASRNPLKTARKNAGLTQARLSEMTGMNLRTIRGYEQGTIPLSSAGAGNLLALSRALGCRVEDFV